MIPTTHKTTLKCSGPQQVAAHKLGSGPDPKWVKENFIYLAGHQEWMARESQNAKDYRAKNGEWAVIIPGPQLIVLTDKEFREMFKPL